MRVDWLLIFALCVYVCRSDYTIISTIAGTGISSYSGDGSAATAATLSYPCAVAVDSSGNVYIDDASDQRIRKITLSTGIISTIVGTGTAGFSGDGGIASSATVYNPHGIALDLSGNVYVSDAYNSRIRKVTVSTSVISTIAGSGATTYNGDNIAATSAALYLPWGITLDSSGNVYVAQYGYCLVRKVTVTTGIISLIAGIGCSTSKIATGDGGAATSARLDPTGVAVDSSGNVYIADGENQRIRKVTLSTNIITTIAGTGATGYSGDGGSATSAKLDYLTGITLDSSGNVYIADNDNNRIRKITVSSQIITTIAGSSTSTGYSGDGGLATSAKLYYPYSVALDTSGSAYIADTYNYRVRKVLNAIPSTTPSAIPTALPTRAPTRVPTAVPSAIPTALPTRAPTRVPTAVPSRQPTALPTRVPTAVPSTIPTALPTRVPTAVPSRHPTAQPSGQPSSKPTGQPTGQPSRQPTAKPTGQPSSLPTTPSGSPTGQPTRQPSSKPTGQPTRQPSRQPTAQPSGQPSRQPTAKPTGQPSSLPTNPTGQPTRQPSSKPSRQPTSQPSSRPSQYCNPGTIIIEDIHCKLCPVGTYAGISNSYYCDLCPSGSYASNEGTSQCTLCAIGYYADTSGSYTCTKCPRGNLTPFLGASDVTACISPTVNFVFGFLLWVLLVVVAFVYIYKRRFMRIAWKRFHETLHKKKTRVKHMHKALMKELKELQKYEEKKNQLTPAQISVLKPDEIKKLDINELMKRTSKATPPTPAQQQAQLIWNYFFFFLLSALCVIIITFVTFILSIVRIGFGTLILWRDYRFVVNVTYVEVLNRQLSKAYSAIQIACSPFVKLFSYFALLNINLDTVNVTCDGSKAPMLLFIDFVILGFVIILIMADYNVVLNNVYGSLYSSYNQYLNYKIRDKLFHGTTCGDRMKFTYNLPRWMITNVIGAILATNPIISFVQLLMGFVIVYPLLTYNSSINTVACNEIAPVPNIDAVLGYFVAAFMWIIAIPVAFILADVLVPHADVQIASTITIAADIIDPRTGKKEEARSIEMIDYVEPHNGALTSSEYKNNAHLLSKQSSSTLNRISTLAGDAKYRDYLFVKVYKAIAKAMAMDNHVFWLLDRWGRYVNGELILKDVDNKDCYERNAEEKFVSKEYDDKYKSQSGKSIERTSSTVTPSESNQRYSKLEATFYAHKLGKFYDMGKDIYTELEEMLMKSLSCQPKTDLSAFFRGLIDGGTTLLLQPCPPVNDYWFLWLSDLFTRLCGLFVILLGVLLCPLVYACLALLAYTGWGTLFILMFPDTSRASDDSKRRKDVVRNQWYYVYRKYVIFAKVTLFGIWDETAYKFYGLYQPEYVRDMNEEYLVYDDKTKVLVFKPSTTIHSLISIRAAMYLLIPYCSIICIYCRFTAGHPLFSKNATFKLECDDTHLREYLGLLATEKCEALQLTFQDVVCDPVKHPGMQKMKPGDGLLYWIEYANLVVCHSRLIQWGFGAYSTVVAMGILFDSRSGIWGYSLLFCALPLSFINSFQVIIFFAYYFRIIANKEDLVVQGPSANDTTYDVQQST